jgi:hypothetical protein
MDRVADSGPDAGAAPRTEENELSRAPDLASPRRGGSHPGYRGAGPGPAVSYGGGDAVSRHRA